MDAACDTKEVGWHSYLSGHFAIIDVNTRRARGRKEERARKRGPGFAPYTAGSGRVRYNERSTVERMNSRVKDSYRGVRVQGHDSTDN